MTTTTSHRSNHDRATHRSKYSITRTDHQPVGQVFVLEIDNDPYARLAYAAYADACEHSNPGLARRIRALLTATADGLGALRLTTQTAPALLESALDANTAIWTSHGRGEYSGHDVTASTTGNHDRHAWVSIAESEPLTPHDIRALIMHLQSALSALEGAPLNIDTYRASATYSREDGSIGQSYIDETTDTGTVGTFCREHRRQGHNVSVETRHWRTLAQAGDWKHAHLS